MRFYEFKRFCHDKFIMRVNDTDEINDAHCHYGIDSPFHSIEGALKLFSNKSYNSLKEDWETYNVKKCILFSQPLPVSRSRYFFETATFPISYGVYIIKNNFFSICPDYSKINKEINENSLKDNRIQFAPFVNHKFSASEIDIYENIKGVKFYEPYGEIPQSLLKYLDEKELNIIVHIWEKTENNQKEFLKIVEKHEAINFQVPHLANGNLKIINALDELDNLYVDTSCCSSKIYKKYVLDGESFEKIVSNHVEKVLFGSDEPYASYKSQIDQINNMKISAKDKERIKEKNFYKIWG